MNTSEFLKELYVKKDYSKLTDLHNAQIIDDKLFTKVLLAQNKFVECADLCGLLGLLFEQGYCLMLSGNLDDAKKIWQNLRDENEALQWGRALIGILESNYKTIPTFFQIRNFLEVDVGYFLVSNNYSLVQQIINSLWLLVRINPECYKYMGRVLLTNNMPADAVIFLEKWKEFQFDDPEIHFLLAKTYTELQMEEQARHSIKNCILIAPQYYPALMFYSQFNKS